MIVLRPIGGASDPARLFDGEWAYDLNARLQHKPPAWTYSPDGANGVHSHWNGGVDYWAQSDGKSFPVQNSRGDSVSLKPIDPQTAETSWFRNGKLVETARETVSADGRQLIAVRWGILSNGAHYVSKLTFHKQ